MASLPSFLTLCIILYLQISTIQSFIKSTKIKPSLLPSLPASDITVTSGPGASVIADLWSITNVQSQGSDLQIQLGSSWGFNPSYISTIELLIDGNTSNETYNDDGEILFVFSVGDQYFTEVVSLDYRKTAYKECPDKGTPLITRDVTEMINGEKPDRYYRYCKNNISQENHGTDYWINAGSTSYKEPVEWPMFMQIINDPINHTVTYNWGDAANNYAIKVFSYYTSSYPTDQGLNVYIAAENLNEDFYIFSIDVTYHYTATPTPTSNPTIAPTTMNPTAIPTIAPITNDPTTENPTTSTPTTSNPTIPPTTANPTTSIPTTNPIKTPTITPITSDPTTDTPITLTTEIPTTAHPTTSTPTGNPTYKPTITPTYKPTVSPTNKPTVIPSNKPTVSPTYKPTVSPTYKPTVIPSYKPTISPSNKATVTPTETSTLSPVSTPLPTQYSTTMQVTSSTHSPTDNPSTTELISPSKSTTPAPTLYVAPKPTMFPTTTSMTATQTVIDETQRDLQDKEGGLLTGFDEKTQYIVAVAVVIFICVVCMVLCVVIKRQQKQMMKHTEITEFNNYDDEHIIHKNSSSMQRNSLYGIQHNIEIDADKDTSSYNGHHYKSSESKLNDAFNLNGRPQLFTHSNISNTVTGDSDPDIDDLPTNRTGDRDSYMMVNQGNNIKKNTFSSMTDMERRKYYKNNVSISLTDLTDRERRRGRTFNNNLANAAAGNDILMDDVVHQMETQGQDTENESPSDELLDTMDDDCYEIGMNNISKISEMNTSNISKPSTMYIEVDGIGHIDNSSGIQTNNFVMDRDNNHYDNHDEDISDELLEEMETAGFIDGDYNELEYEDEYYEEDEYEEDD